ncbi:unnamed protein product, partial [Vitis vinifera]
MDSIPRKFSGSKNGQKLYHESVSINSDHNVVERFMDPPFLPTKSHPYNSATVSGARLEEDSAEDCELSIAMLKYMGEILMEDELEDKNCMFQDCVALLAAEKSFYDLGQLEASRKKLHQNEQSKGSNGKAGRVKKKHNKGELVDLNALLIQCAQAVAAYNQRAANDILKLIRQHSSPFGNGSQRLAHFFANSLEARLAGTGLQMYTALATKRTSVADVIKAYQLYVSACPFKRMSNRYANRVIAKLAEGATRLHIIDFGVLYGFQWPCLIQFLSLRPGGPPKLRITGIDFPQPGFRPAERVEETGRRLANYCKRFKVPFEYKAIAQRWETIKVEDLEIDRDGCLKDAVLELIRRINPDIFIHGVLNGNFNTPFFFTRFREALFHFDALFDMLDASVPREDEGRMMFEREIYGKDIMNIIACEGSERIERPDIYKQWQARNERAGLRQLPLEQEILMKVRNIVKMDYHKDFVVEVDGGWMLHGWKGRVIYAISCWKPCHHL